VSQVSKYLRKSSVGYLFYCPGCEEIHSFRVGGDNKRPQWTFNGDVERPSFAPSLLNFTVYDENNKRLPEGKRRTLCHLFVKTGEELAKVKPDIDRSRSYIHYCGDNPHKLNGQIVPLPELPDYAQGDQYGDGNP
jgi:Family of unknown function (DUF6527)